MNFTQYFHWVSKFLKGKTNLHVVGLAPFCWAIWKLRNRAYFEKKLIKNPVEIICSACLFLKYWAGLQNELDKADCIRGAEMIQETALALHRASTYSLRIKAVDSP